MIKTEAVRDLLEIDIKLPDDVRKALDDYNKTHPMQLDLLFDEETNAWQFYMIKTKGVTSKEDLLHWQMSVPTKGTMITPGIIDWLKQYDTSQGGYLEQDDIRKRWLECWNIARCKEKEDKQKRKNEFEYAMQPFMQDFLTQRTTVAVPQTVGYNPKTKKNVLAVPKGTGKKMKKQQRRIKVGN